MVGKQSLELREDVAAYLCRSESVLALLFSFFLITNWSKFFIWTRVARQLDRRGL